jgi:N-carbamoyl-L-amino-acid hydrolase
MGGGRGRAGFDVSALGRDDEAMRRIGAYVELHVEQGRHLALPSVDAGVGVGTGIWPHGRFRLDIAGSANHAGTTRLVDRDDPMLALAQAVLVARSAAERHEAVATIGRIDVAPGSTNAIPSLVRAWLDARAPSEESVRSVVRAVGDAAGVEAATESWSAAVAFDSALRDRVAAAASAALGEAAPALATGAGHDAGILAAAGVPTAMLFVRNPTGVSHAPDEHADRSDCLAGVRALAAVLEDLAC